MTTLNIGSSLLPVFEELVNSVESNPGSECESKQHNHNSAANRYKGNKFASVIRFSKSVVVVVVVPSNGGKPRHKSHNCNLKHDGGGVDGDVDEGGEDELGVAGLEAVQHEGAEHDGEDSLNSGEGTADTVASDRHCHKRHH